VFECWLHPSRYRTQLCKDGTGCGRRICFFAHTEEELRPCDLPLEEAEGSDESAGGSLRLGWGRCVCVLVSTLAA